MADNFFWEVEIKGGEGSGHHRHSGLPGVWGGSRPRGNGPTYDGWGQVVRNEKLPRTANVRFAENWDKAEWKNSEIEQAVIVRDGEVLVEKGGDRTNIHFEPEELALMGGSVLIHNHPRGTSFSLGDLTVAEYNRLEEIRAITPDGTIYRYRPVGDDDLAQHIHYHFYDPSFEEVYDEMMEEGFEEGLSSELDTQYGKEFRHRLILRIGDRARGMGYDFQYERVSP